MSDDLTRPFDPGQGGPGGSGGAGGPLRPSPSDGPLSPSPSDGPLSPPPAGPSVTGPSAPPAVPDVRRGLARLSRGLVAYGVIGIVVAVLGLGLLLYANTRLDEAGDRVEASLQPLATTLDRTATALHDAATTAQTFGTTLDRTEEAVSAAAATIISVRTNLETLESVFRAVNILGVSPLGPAADAVGGIANAIEGLDSRLTAIADGLATNGASLAANASSLDSLGDSIATMAERLRSGVVEDSLADVHLAILILLLVLTVWTAVPAVGALVLGVWLRRELEAADDLTGQASSCRSAERAA